ncbi:MAG: hypothetical protein ACO307_17505 [Ilumatobacteraceae bacterium]
MKYRVTSPRLAGTAEGDIISAEGLVKLGIDIERALAKNLIVVSEDDYAEPKKHRGARKDASDDQKD